MVWHIFKKDVKLLWPYVALLVFVYVLNTWIWLQTGHFDNQATIAPLRMFSPVLGYLGVALLVIAVFHQDVVPGDRQDWVVRPIHRHHLLLSKLLFLALALLAPMFAVDVATVLMTGFSAADALRSSLARAGAFLCLICLPAAGVAAVTRKLTQAVVLVGVASVAILALTFLLMLAVEYRLPLPEFSSPPSTLVPVVWFARAGIALVAAAAILGVMFARRRQGLATIVFAVAVLLGAACEYLPWPSISDLRAERLTAQVPSGVQVSFDPDGQKGSATPAIGGRREISLPLRITDLPTDSALFVDHAEISLVGADGAILQRYAYYGTRFSLLDVPSVRQEAGEAAHTWQRIRFSSADYTRLKDEPLRIEIAYRFTLFAAEPTATFPAIGADTRFPDGSGWCKTAMRPEIQEIMVGCLSPRARPACVRMFLENPATGDRNPETFACSPVYAPFNARIYPMVLGDQNVDGSTAVGDMIVYGALSGRLGFHDYSGARKFPVDENQFLMARVQRTGYRPRATLTRQLVIPEIRLRDWEPEPATTFGPMRLEMP